MREIILLSIAGPDKPGVTSALTGVLSQHAVNILDGILYLLGVHDREIH